MSALQHFAFTSRRYPRQGPFLFGASIGLIGSLLYLVLGGDVFILVPLWAAVIFLPGFYVGDLLYNHVGFTTAVIAGIVAVMLTYGILALIIRLVINPRRKITIDNE